MSMNLCFRTCQGNHLVEFPYQTSTDVTYAVIDATTVEQRLQLIKEDIMACVDSNNAKDVAYANEQIADIKDMLNDQTLTLSYI